MGGEPAEAFQRTWSFRFSTQRPSLVPIMRQLKNAKWKSYLSHTPDCLNLLISCLPVHGHFLGSFPAPASLCPGGFAIHAASLSLGLPLIQCFSCSILPERVVLACVVCWPALPNAQLFKHTYKCMNVYCMQVTSANKFGWCFEIVLLFCGCMKSVHYRVLFIILTRVKTPLTETVKHPNTFFWNFEL